MNGPSVAGETFRRVWFTQVPEWTLAGGVAMAVVWAADHLNAPVGGTVLGLAALPLAWGAWRALRWFYHTWTATADGLLIEREGLLRRTRRVIHLRSAHQVSAEAAFLVGWLDVGHIAFQAADDEGQTQAFYWTWMDRYSRLYEIIRARGSLPPEPPAWRRLLAG